MCNLIGEEVYLGKFKVESGALTIGDPCYSPDTWCLGHCEDVVDGTWMAKALKIDDSLTGWGDRISALFAFNVNYFETNYEIDDIEIKRFAHGAYKTQFTLDYTIESIGVDSGQAGIYDHQHYLKEKELDNQEDRKDRWYWQNGDITLSKAMAGVINKGCVSSSGYGDGSYDYHCYYKEGCVIAVLIVFIDKEEGEN